MVPMTEGAARRPAFATLRPCGAEAAAPDGEPRDSFVNGFMRRPCGSIGNPAGFA
jgi:hypothetical protein